MPSLPCWGRDRRGGRSISAGLTKQGLLLLRHLHPSWTYFHRSSLPEFAPLRFTGGQPLSETELGLDEQLVNRARGKHFGKHQAHQCSGYVQARGFLPFLFGDFSVSDAFVRGYEPLPQQGRSISEPPARTMMKLSEHQCSSSKCGALAQFACCSCLSLSQERSSAFYWGSSTKPARPIRYLMEDVWGWLTRILDHQNPPISR